jgi:malate dehydrogenase (oxaloacetate-decarboxylating)
LPHIPQRGGDRVFLVAHDDNAAREHRAPDAAGGRALVATGSPAPPVTHQGRVYPIAQANNALVFPGLGLGVTVARARRVSDGMIEAAADALAHLCAATSTESPLLPPVEELRTVSAAVGAAVARAASKEGLAQIPIDDADRQVRQAMWQPEYPAFEAV